MGYVYSNPYADAANAFSGGVNTIGDTVLKMAMLKQQGMQRQQELMMQMAQMNQTGQYQQQKLGMDKEELGLRKTESGARVKHDEALTEETKQRGVAEKQRLEDALKMQGYRDTFNKLSPQIRQMRPPALMKGPPFGDAMETPMLDQGGLQQLLGAGTALSKTPQEGMQLSLLIQALQNGALSPQAEQSIVTGFPPQSPRMDPQLAIILKGLSGVLQKNATGPEDYMSGMNKVLGGNPLGGGGQQPTETQPIFAVNPQTKQRIVSLDGGVTWQPAQ